MTDESNDIAVLKQLVLVGRYQMSDSGVKTSFFHIQDMRNGKAETIEEAILIFLQTNSLNICDRAWEKGPCRANNDFSV